MSTQFYKTITRDKDFVPCYQPLLSHKELGECMLLHPSNKSSPLIVLPLLICTQNMIKEKEKEEKRENNGDASHIPIPPNLINEQKKKDTEQNAIRQSATSISVSPSHPSRPCLPYSSRSEREQDRIRRLLRVRRRRVVVIARLRP